MFSSHPVVHVLQTTTTTNSSPAVAAAASVASSPLWLSPISARLLLLHLLLSFSTS